MDRTIKRIKRNIIVKYFNFDILGMQLRFHKKEKGNMIVTEIG